MTRPDHRDDDQKEHSSWSAPDDETGAVVPLRAVLFQDDMTAIMVTDIVAYSTGFAFELNVLRRVDDILRLIEHSLGRHSDAAGRIVRLMIEYGDGRRASNLDALEDGPTDIWVRSSGGGGGGTSYASHYWAGPIPPPGQMRIGVGWGSINLAPTHVEIDTDPIIDAAAQSERPWRG